MTRFWYTIVFTRWIHILSVVLKYLDIANLHHWTANGRHGKNLLFFFHDFLFLKYYRDKGKNLSIFNSELMFCALRLLRCQTSTSFFATRTLPTSTKGHPASFISLWIKCVTIKRLCRRYIEFFGTALTHSVCFNVSSLKKGHTKQYKDSYAWLLPLLNVKILS